MTPYTELFVVPVPRNNRAAYLESSETFVKVWTEHGALSCVVLEADDAPMGKVTSFPQSVQLKPDETVFVGIMTYASPAHRKEVSSKAMKDQRMAGMRPEAMPFDGKRMFWGGFKAFSGTSPVQANSIQPYLFFRGRCEEALQYYQDKLGAEAGVMMRFRDNPDKPDRDKVPAELDDRIMHADIKICGSQIMMSDGWKSGPLDFQCMSLALSLDDETEAHRLFNALAEDGTVQMPMGPTFFAKTFGSVADKFGVSWMIIVPPEASDA
jgi:PhnB protein